MKIRFYFIALFAIAFASPLVAQTNFAVLADDGAWTWYNDPRAIFHNGKLYFGYVRAADSKTVLSVFELTNGIKTDLWSSGFTQRDDHNNPGLLAKQDGRLLAIYSRHGSDEYFSYRTSSSTNPAITAGWNPELSIPNSGAGMTYANPFQLSTEGGRIYNFCRNLNFNPTIYTSADGGTNWSAPQHFIKTGTGSIRPYVKYASDGTSRIDFLYTDGHPRDVANSLYHLYYSGGAFYQTDGTFVTNYSALPLQHDSGQRGAVIYQYSDTNTPDPNDHIPTGRAWTWEIAYQSNGAPACVFTVQRDQVTGPNWFDDRIYYYYARWTGSEWQKRFIAQAGRPLYSSEDDYAGGICMDPQEPNVIYISSNAQNPFNLTDTTNVALRAQERYEIWRGVTSDGGLTFAWTQITTNSTADNLRPYVPRRNGGDRCVIWFRGSYVSYTSYTAEIVGLFSQPVPTPPKVTIVNPTVPLVAFTNLGDQLKLTATLADDGHPQPATISWTTLSGPLSAQFQSTNQLSTRVTLPVPGTYVLRVTANDSLSSDSDELTVMGGPTSSDLPDSSRVLSLKLNESSGNVASNSASANNGTASGGFIWRPTGGAHNGAIEFDGSSGQVVVPDANDLDATTAFTLAYWFNANAYPADSAGLVCKRNNIADNNAYTTYLKTSDKRIYVDIDGSNNRFSSSTLINLGQWYHVAVTFDGSLPSADRAKLWINGVLDVSAAESSATIPNYTSAFRLGNTHPGAANWFNGRIDDVLFFRRALSGIEIASLAISNFGPSVVTQTFGATNQIPASPIGLVTDDNGPPAAYWSIISGPGSATFANSNSAATTVTFNRSGTYTLRLSASDGQVEVSQDIFALVAANTNVFEDWMALFYPGETNSSIVGPGADAENDSVINFGEFAVGLNPSVADAAPFATNAPGLPRAAIANFSGTNYLVLQVNRPTGRLAIAYDAEVSGDMLAWLPAVQVGSATSNGDGTELLIFRDTQPADAAQARFMRLKLTKY